MQRLAVSAVFLFTVITYFILWSKISLFLCKDFSFCCLFAARLPSRPHPYAEMELVVIVWPFGSVGGVGVAYCTCVNGACVTL